MHQVVYPPNAQVWYLGVADVISPVLYMDTTTDNFTERVNYSTSIEPMNHKGK